MSEFSIIEHYFKWGTTDKNIVLGIGDDAAVLSIPSDQQLVISVDTSNAGIHFPVETPPHAIGYKSLAVNLSDIAAMGAIPKWFTLALSLPESNPQWLSEFTRGMRELADQHHVALVGGDTTRGSLSITIQIMGCIPKQTALLRSQAQHGDFIFVSGALGEAATGLALLQNRASLPTTLAEACVQRLNYPTPRVDLARALQPYIHACMDISDGLLGDLPHILAASKVGATLHTDKFYFSPALLALPLSQRLPFMLQGGDDYELLFTAPAENLPIIKKISELSNIPLTMIGQVDATLSDLYCDGKRIDKRHGYDHFS